ncbi:hypothetical protein Mgra_00010054 [Meloidogyne graminicola]|uniref:Uncharacterized protein n=1 Tax=Meloidogyne graminicola TaxID=189291 RepID=A0A8S9Z7V0_9BILA|nr:hypothetical protein Mgra_00010054 [Meloidogyne graminicola]
MFHSFTCTPFSELFQSHKLRPTITASFDLRFVRLGRNLHLNQIVNLLIRFFSCKKPELYSAKAKHMDCQYHNNNSYLAHLQFTCNKATPSQKI